MKKFGYSKILDISISDAINNLSLALKNEGFGFLTEINMKSKLKEKLDKEIDDYIILGVCNPSLAYESLQSEYEIGLLLPCNIIVYKKNNKTIVSTIVPTVAMNIIENDKIKSIAIKAENKLKNVIDSL